LEGNPAVAKKKEGSRGIFVYTARKADRDIETMPMFSKLKFQAHVVVRAARRFLSERRVGECPCRLGVVAIDNRPGQPPVVRLHKDAFSARM